MSPQSLPPLDGSVPLFPGFVDWHAEHNPHDPIYVFPFPDLDSDKLSTISFVDFAHATHRIAHSFRPGRTGPDGALVAILANCDSALYHALIAGLARAGFVPFPMSPRNSAVAVANLLESTGCHRIVSQPTFAPLLDGIRKTVTPGFEVHIDELPPFGDIFPALSSSFDPPAPAPDAYPAATKHVQPDDILLYLHSSGSTGHPKPIPHTHTTIIQWCLMPLIIESRKRAIRWGCMALPGFHVMGLCSQLYAPLVSGQPTSLFPPRALQSAPPVVPTPQNTIDTARKTGCTAIESVPAFVEAWAHNEEDMKYLATLDSLIFAGGPLASATGDKLVANGVRLFSCYGATEFGTLTCIYDDDVDAPSPIGKTRHDWQWMAIPSDAKPRWIPQGDGTYELQFLACPTHQPSVNNLPNGERGYSTSDLFEPHPTKRGLWRVVGRTDDVIVLGSGEKAVPIPQEKHIDAHPMVTGALMFGRGKQQVGVLIELKPEFAIPAGDESAVIKFRNVIWPQIEESNQTAPTFARIFKEMIIVADPARPFIRAAKGTIQRKKTLEMYKDEIEALYKTIEESRDSHGVAPPPSWNVKDIQAWLALHAAAINGDKMPKPERDLFEQGFDSLSSTFLRNRIIGALRESSDPAVNSAAQHVSPNFIFQHPTLVALAAAVAKLVRPGATVATHSPAEEIDLMIAKYTAKLPPAPTSRSNKAKDGLVVLLSGTTGSLGAHILELLLSDSRVKRIYALNRGSDLPTRQRAAFESAGLKTELLSKPNVVYLSGDFGREDIGLAQSVLAELSASVTHIIHNAWRVDFNLTLASFETHIANAVRLLALVPDSYYLFTSSVSVAGGWRAAQGRGPVPEKPLGNAEIPARSSGYGMSKYTVEMVLANARAAGLRTTSLRIGQISGSSRSGAWNKNEWVPNIVKTSIALDALPDLDGLVSWVPMDCVASAAVDVMFSSAEPDLVDIVHPRPVSWRESLSGVNAELGRSLPFISLDDWVKKIEGVAEGGASADDLETIPGIKLLEYFRSLSAMERDARESHVTEIEVGGLPLFHTEKVESVSPTIAKLRPLGEEDARAWVKYWKNIKFIA
ncbi:acetyl-CoA synthetase-like protein [Laetiporus sulphureus 93-53]|uniref:Acetyl-CoA synthetase-like protein n=1 Tax=Laetiporus sulphureus 93-53 TaxID=1314785 RepID=A0A165DCA6_9APHY|nr:acetyl-CoA synthetase-like protein [Laetiporus sulphureus 93-53]KZT04547.1 acetyl-CoA synthetase-like protein [Laetiporus sulphureus 93-53]